MKFFIVGLCSVFLLGCSFSSNQTNTEPPIEIEDVVLEDTYKVIDGDVIPVQPVPVNNKRIETVEAQIGGQTFNLEVSESREDREMGLMHRESIQFNEGMLFVFELPARHRFWMKNTLIPLDILWLNESKEIIHFETAVPCYSEPCDIYGPTELSKYVIELPAGSFVEEIGTVVQF